MPKDTPVSKLTGYSAVKDGNDFLLAKGLNKFFNDLTEGDWVDKKTNVRLEMSKTGSGKSGDITSRIFDLDDDLAILCKKTVTDTPMRMTSLSARTNLLPVSSTVPSSLCSCLITTTGTVLG